MLEKVVRQFGLIIQCSSIREIRITFNQLQIISKDSKQTLLLGDSKKLHCKLKYFKDFNETRM